MTQRIDKALDEAIKNYVPKEGEHVLWPGFPPVHDDTIRKESHRIGKEELCAKWEGCENNEERKEVYRELAHYIRQHDRITPRLDKYSDLDVPRGCKKDHVQIIAMWTDQKQVYEVTFSFELVFQTKRSRTKRFNSWEAKFKGFLQNASLREIITEPGMKVKLVEKQLYGKTKIR